MSIETLKEQARRHEQKEEWQKALDQYGLAIVQLAEEEQPDIGLYNRVGDLYVRVGNLDAAVKHYEQSVDLYMESFLSNNAIAVCKKIIRNVPAWHSAYLKMGQIRAEQGFLPDARTNFLTYAERMQEAGDLDESFRALVEFCDLAPDDVDLRTMVADQMASHDRKDDAVEQLSSAYRHLLAEGATAEASAVEAKIRELDASADLGGIPAMASAEPDSEGSSEADDLMGHFSDIATADYDDQMSDDSGAEVDLGGFDIDSDDDAEEQGSGELSTLGVNDDAEDEEGSDLPTFDTSDATDDAPGAELPTFDMGDDADDEPGAELPTFDTSDATDDAPGAELPTFDMGDDADDESGAELPTLDTSDATDDAPGAELPTFDMGDDAEDESGAELPTFDTSDATDDEPGAELPTFDMGDDAEDESGAELPTFDTSDATDDEPGAELPTFDTSYEPGDADGAPEEDAASEAEQAVQEAIEVAATDDAADEALTIDDVRGRIAKNPGDVALRQRLVELAYGTGEDAVVAEAFLGLARTLDEAGEDARAQAAYQQVLEADPGNEVATAALGDAPSSQPVPEVAASEDYVDLGSLILGDDDEEKSTRFTVAYDEPSGDEQADFAKMLSQFKDKVSENLDTDDVQAHHDLGTAYKEMGLLDEAVSEFQAALRASADHLPTYELLGVTFMEMGQPEATVHSLERALEIEYNIEDELLGIYYYLARANEDLGQADRALELYEKVFSLDINFADVTERLRDLR